MSKKNVRACYHFSSSKIIPFLIFRVVSGRKYHIVGIQKVKSKHFKTVFQNNQEKKYYGKMEKRINIIYMDLTFIFHRYKYLYYYLLLDIKNI